MRVVIKKGDITAEKVDAVVNPANTRLIMGGGVAGAIKRKGGKEIEDEARAQGPVEIGQAVLTGAGKLPAKWVIHSPTMGMDFQTDEAKIRASVRAAVELALQKGIKSVAFPAMGTGVGGFPYEKAAKVMYEEVSRFKNEDLEVRFVLWGDEAFEAFKKTLSGKEGVEVVEG